MELTAVEKFRILDRFSPTREEYNKMPPYQRHMVDVEIGRAIREALADRGCQLSDFLGIDDILNAIDELRSE